MFDAVRVWLILLLTSGTYGTPKTRSHSIKNAGDTKKNSKTDDAYNWITP